MRNDLTFERLRRINVERCEQVFHKLKDWSPTDWATAFAGEAGEACNLIKKLRRLDGADTGKDTAQERARLKDAIIIELADAVIYADLLAAALDRDLEGAVVQKFNEVSDKRGSSFFL